MTAVGHGPFFWGFDMQWVAAGWSVVAARSGWHESTSEVAGLTEAVVHVVEDMKETWRANAVDPIIQDQQKSFDGGRRGYGQVELRLQIALTSFQNTYPGEACIRRRFRDAVKKHGHAKPVASMLDGVGSFRFPRLVVT